MYVQEDEMWSGKGRFKNAVQDLEPIKWNLNDKGEMLLSILTVMFFIYFEIFVIKFGFLLGCGSHFRTCYSCLIQLSGIGHDLYFSLPTRIKLAS